eukprot:scaffold12299_cov58-Phaeocystis_antarctica.AAC.3
MLELNLEDIGVPGDAPHRAHAAWRARNFPRAAAVARKPHAACAPCVARRPKMYRSTHPV